MGSNGQDVGFPEKWVFNRCGYDHGEACASECTKWPHFCWRTTQLLIFTQNGKPYTFYETLSRLQSKRSFENFTPLFGVDAPKRVLFVHAFVAAFTFDGLSRHHQGGWPRLGKRHPRPDGPRLKYSPSPFSHPRELFHLAPKIKRWPDFKQRCNNRITERQW